MASVGELGCDQNVLRLIEQIPTQWMTSLVMTECGSRDESVYRGNSSL